MEDGYLVWGFAILLQICGVGYFYYKKWRLKKVDAEIFDGNWHSYLKQREDLLKTSAAELDIQIIGNDETVFGVGYEIHNGSKVSLTIIFSNAVIKAINSVVARNEFLANDSEEVTAATKNLMTTAQYHFARMRKRNMAVPEPGYTKFYILTNNDIYAAESRFADIANKNTDWQKLLEDIDEVFDAIDAVEK